jgi:hypothetical protein|uniref:Uncharacterized protein n=1 Tax=Desulfobacca acetoxidans TaxID=60893 RepID=A0A7C5EL18_9BACT
MTRRGFIELVVSLPGAILIGLLGCSHFQVDTFPAPSWNPPALAKPIIVKQERIFAHPGVENLRLSRVGVLYFRSPDHIPEVGPGITQLFYRELLARRPFQEVVLIPEPFTTEAEALKLARRHRLQLLVLGEVPYYLDGGTLGLSGLQLDLRVVEVDSGRLLWCLSDSLRARPRPIVSLMVVETRPRPTPDMGTLASKMAAQLAQTLEQGAPLPSEKEDQRSISRN